MAVKSGNKQRQNNRKSLSLEKMAQKIYEESRENEKVQNYFNERGINRESIDRFQLGISEFDGCDRFVIPVRDITGCVAYLKLRITPDDESAEEIAKAMGKRTSIGKSVIYPTDAKRVLIGEDDLTRSTSSDVLICRDELERIVAMQEGIQMPVVSGDDLVQTFRNEWIDELKKARNIYLCLGEDAVSKRGTEVLAKRLAEQIPTASIFVISLPSDDGTYMSLASYLTKNRGGAEKLFGEYAEFYGGKKPIDASKFKELSVEDVSRVLDLTIKDNFENKVIIFLAMLLAYTENLQLNIIMNAESSSGKTYLVNEVSNLFPEQDVYQYGNASPTSPYHSEKFKKIDERGVEYSDLERRILIFEDQPNPQLLANLRSFLSHDLKKTPFMLTNKNKSGKITAPESYILGFSSVFFCSANLRIDGQEQTRSFILSPENTEETIRASVDACIDRDSDESAYQNWLDSNENRNDLKDRIVYIKDLKVKYIDLYDKKYVRDRFYENLPFVTPGTRRKIKQFIALIKGIALLNAPFRMVGERIVATNNDVDEAVKLWGVIKESMSYGVAPEILDFYETYIQQACLEKPGFKKGKDGITQDELATYYFDQNGRSPNFEMIKKVYIPTLKRSKIIKYERDKNNGQRWLIIPLVFIKDDIDDDSEL